MDSPRARYDRSKVRWITTRRQVALTDQWVAYMLDQINLFCHQLVSPSTEKVKDMSLWFNYLSYDIMGEMVFGRGFSMLTDPSLRYMLDLIDSTVFSYLLVCLFSLSAE